MDTGLASAYEAIGLGALSDEEYDLSTDEKADALAERINHAYRLRSLIDHPDKGGSNDAFLHLCAAFNKIRDSHKGLQTRLIQKFGS
jgi:hypothetical protein